MRSAALPVSGSGLPLERRAPCAPAGRGGPLAGPRPGGTLDRPRTAEAASTQPRAQTTDLTVLFNSTSALCPHSYPPPALHTPPRDAPAPARLDEPQHPIMVPRRDGFSASPPMCRGHVKERAGVRAREDRQHTRRQDVRGSATCSAEMCEYMQHAVADPGSRPFARRRRLGGRERTWGCPTPGAGSNGPGRAFLENWE